MDIKVTYDPAADEAYIYLVDTPPGGVYTNGMGISSAEEVGEEELLGLTFDYSQATGRLVGIEVHGASAVLPDEVLEQAERYD